MKKPIKNLPASVMARLQAISRQEGRPFNETLQYYALERFLARLSLSRYQQDFILKGGLIFKGWRIPLRRPTKDIDLQANLENSVELITSIIKEICSQPIEPDGIMFDPGTIRHQIIVEKARKHGLRILLIGNLGTAQIHLQLDISFDNAITPSSISLKYPTLLDHKEPEVQGYPFETTIAEKFEAMVSLGSANGRMKDFYDIWLLSREIEINGRTLGDAIVATFQNRETQIPEQTPRAFTEEFARDKLVEWNAFVNRSDIDLEVLPDLEVIIQDLRAFIEPVLNSIRSKTQLDATWNDGQWRETQ